MTKLGKCLTDRCEYCNDIIINEEENQTEIVYEINSSARKNFFIECEHQLLHQRCILKETHYIINGSYTTFSCPICKIQCRQKGKYLII